MMDEEEDVAITTVEKKDKPLTIDTSMTASTPLPSRPRRPSQDSLHDMNSMMNDIDIDSHDNDVDDDGDIHTNHNEENNKKNNLNSPLACPPSSNSHPEHKFQAGDHVIRWEMLPIAWPIQIHGIVLSVNETTVVLVDFGLAAAPQAGPVPPTAAAAAETAANATADTDPVAARTTSSPSTANGSGHAIMEETKEDRSHDGDDDVDTDDDDDVDTEDEDEDYSNEAVVDMDVTGTPSSKQSPKKASWFSPDPKEMDLARKEWMKKSKKNSKKIMASFQKLHPTSKRQRLNLLVLDDPAEWNKWKKVNYDKGLFGFGGSGDNENGEGGADDGEGSPSPSGKSKWWEKMNLLKKSPTEDKHSTTAELMSSDEAPTESKDDMDDKEDDTTTKTNWWKRPMSLTTTKPNTTTTATTTSMEGNSEAKSIETTETTETDDLGSVKNDRFHSTKEMSRNATTWLKKTLATSLPSIQPTSTQTPLETTTTEAKTTQDDEAVTTTDDDMTSTKEVTTKPNTNTWLKKLTTGLPGIQSTPKASNGASPELKANQNDAVEESMTNDKVTEAKSDQDETKAESTDEVTSSAEIAEPSTKVQPVRAMNAAMAKLMSKRKEEADMEAASSNKIASLFKYRLGGNKKSDSTQEGNEGHTGEAPTTPKKKLDLPTADPPKLVLARTRWLLEHGETVLPPYHAFHANSECIAVYCKTGYWSNIQADVFLHSTAIGNAKTMGVATMGVAASLPLLAPVIAGLGIGLVAAPWLVLSSAKKQAADITQKMNELFWAQAEPEVFVECIQHWSKLDEYYANLKKRKEDIVVSQETVVDSSTTLSDNNNCSNTTTEES